jgi:hypothetical protein
MRLRLGPFGFRIEETLDPNNRQDDDRCGFLRSVTPETHNAPLTRKFDYVTHQPFSSAAGKVGAAPCAVVGIAMIKQRQG